jgi:hypothetical protein
MRLSINIDSFHHEIDTADPELMARWIIEIFGRMREWTPGTWIAMSAYPSVLPDPDNPDAGWRTDWIADSRIIGQVHQIRSPRELVAALSRQIDEYEQLHREGN